VIVAATLYALRGAAAAVWGTLGAAGVALLLTAAVANATALAAFVRRRDARRGADAVLATLFLAAILVIVQATSVRHSHSFDLTRNRRHTLAPQTVSLLDSLDRDVDVTGFFRQTSSQRDNAEQLLARYARHSSRFHYQLADPDRRPDLAQRLGASINELVVQAGDDRRVVRTIDEEGLTNALVSITRAGTRAVYFVSGHGEKDVDVTARDGYSAAKQALASQGYAVFAASLLDGSPVPPHTAALVVAGPRDDYFADEVRSIDRYLRAGGSVLFMLDPRVDLPRLTSLLPRYHLAVVDAVVLDQRELDSGDRSFDATVAKIRRYQDHAITKNFNFVTMFPRARPVMITPDSARAGLDVRYLCVTDDDAWGEKDMESFSLGRASRDGSDLAGPLPLAAAATLIPMVAGESGPKAGPESRVVLIGDSDFAGNSMLGVLGNSDFFLNTIAFLTEEENLIRIRPRRVVGDSVYITERQGRLVFLVCLIVLPLAPVVAGTVVLARRRRL
jgi:ABC-type uncharacterized transport system involved in gliding motility auxiliary subunit